MSTARELAEFLTRITPGDLPAQAMDHAAMLIASTIASAAIGQRHRIRRDHPRHGEGARRHGAGLGVVRRRRQAAGRRRGAGQRGDERRRGLGRQRSAQRSCIAARRWSRPRWRSPSTTARSGEEVLAAIVLGYELAGRIIDAMPGSAMRGFHGSHARDLRGDGRGGAAAAARCRADDARDRADRDLGRRAGEGGRYQRRARVPCRQRRRCSASRRRGRRSAATRARSASSK